MQKWHLNCSSSKQNICLEYSPARSLALPCSLLMLWLDTDPKCSSFLSTLGVAACVGALHPCCSPVCYSLLFCCYCRYMKYGYQGGYSHHCGAVFSLQGSATHPDYRVFLTCVYMSDTDGLLLCAACVNKHHISVSWSHYLNIVRSSTVKRAIVLNTVQMMFCRILLCHSEVDLSPFKYKMSQRHHFIQLDSCMCLFLTYNMHFWVMAKSVLWAHSVFFFLCFCCFTEVGEQLWDAWAHWHVCVRWSNV